MSWEQKRVWIVVKAYPEYSRKSRGEVVCTAGITEEGNWIRLYPISTKYYIGDNKIHKFDLVEVTCQKAESEKLGRKESYKVKEGSDITALLNSSPTTPITTGPPCLRQVMENHLTLDLLDLIPVFSCLQFLAESPFEH